MVAVCWAHLCLLVRVSPLGDGEAHSPAYRFMSAVCTKASNAPTCSCKGIVQVRPLSEALALAPRALAFLQAGALLAAGAVQIGLVRVVVQRFADSSLLAWHQLKHGLMGEWGWEPWR